MEIPFLDVKAAYLELQADLDEAYRRVAHSGWYILGQELEAFEREFAEYCQARHCIGVGNGLDALSLLLKAVGIGPGDEVLVPANTFIATWLAVTYAGATPVPVEPDPATFNIDPARLEAALSPRTRAIIAVHLYGQPAEMDSIRAVARTHRLHVFEDAAQAHGARYKGRRAGTLADGAGFSFYPGKNLGAMGDAGAVVTDNDEIAARIRLLRNYGSARKYDHETAGVNSRLDPLQAAFLRAKLKHLDAWNARRREIAAIYSERLRLLPSLVLPYVPPCVEPVWHLYVVRAAFRDCLQADLAEAGVNCLIHYPQPPHLSGAYAHSGRCRGDLPITEELSSTILSLPMGPHLDAPAAMHVTAQLERILGTDANLEAIRRRFITAAAD